MAVGVTGNLLIWTQALHALGSAQA